jgi:hypothetical protein
LIHTNTCTKNMIMKKLLYTLTVLLLTSGCAEQRFDPNPSFKNRSFVLLKNYDTNDYKDCSAAPKDPLTMYETVEECKKDYESQGYEVYREY